MADRAGFREKHGTMVATGKTYQITALWLADGLFWFTAHRVTTRDDEPEVMIDGYVIYDPDGNEVARNAPTFQPVVVPNVKAGEQVNLTLSLDIQVTGTRHPAKVS